MNPSDPHVQHAWQRWLQLHEEAQALWEAHDQAFLAICKDDFSPDPFDPLEDPSDDDIPF